MYFFLVLAMVFLASLALAAPRIAPPEATFTDKGRINAIAADLDAQKYADAIAQMDQLQNDASDQLLSDDDATLLAVSTRIAQSVGDKRTLLSLEFDRKKLTGARAVLRAVQGKKDAGPQDAYAVARRYPYSAVTAEALVVAAEMSADIGDIPGAVDLLSLGESVGATLDDAQAKRLAALRAMNAIPSALPMLFENNWYQSVAGFEATRSFPIWNSDRAYVVSERYVFALESTGLRSWMYAPPRPWSAQTRDQSIADTGRGALFQPAMLCDSTGIGQVIVVRQPQQQGPRGCLRALRCVDGKLLWSTENDPRTQSLNIISQPTVCGRYVYVLLVDPGMQSSAMRCAAFEITSGRIVWSTNIGTLIGLDRLNDILRQREAEDFWRQSAPAVSQGQIVVSPNIGWTICLDRFDGSIRWAKKYETQTFNVELKYRLHDGRNIGKLLQSPPASFVRFSNAPVLCEGVAVVAPYDSDSLMGFSRFDGRRIWTIAPPEPATLIGGNANLVLLVGSKVTAINVKTGKPAWDFSPPAQIVGSPIVVGSIVYVPQPGGLVSLSLVDGKITQGTAPDFREISQTNGAKAAFAGAGLAGVFERQAVKPVIVK